MRSNTIAGVGLCAALLLVACSQGRDHDQQSAGNEEESNRHLAQTSLARHRAMLGRWSRSVDRR